VSDFRQKVGLQRWSGPLVASVVALAIAAIVLLTGIPTLIGAISSPSWDGRTDDVFATLESAHERQAEVNSRRFLGRSPFVVPSRPGTRPAAPAPRVERPRPDPRPEPPKVDPGPPKTYTGPAPTGVAGTVVFFGSSMKILRGEEKDGVKVIGILSPTLVRLGHKGGDYEVSFLDDDYSTIFKPFAGSPGSDILGRAPERSEPPAGNVSASSDSPATDAPWTPERGSAVSVTFNDGDRERTLVGRIQYIGRAGSGSQSRSMVIRGQQDGRTVFQRIDESQLIEMGEIPEGEIPPLEEIEEPTEEVVPEGGIDPLIETTLRGMQNPQLESRQYQITAVLQRPELAENMRIGLEVELELIISILRERANEG
jgi:hypothetical protein